MSDFWRRQLDYSRWAQEQWLEFLREHLDPKCAEQRLLAHVVAAEGIWLARIQGKGQPGPVWPEWSLEEISMFLEKSHEGYGLLFDQHDFDGSREVRYTNTEEESFITRLEEILHHVSLHGAYHRGQMAAKARAAGRRPPTTDFIAFVRNGK